MFGLSFIQYWRGDCLLRGYLMIGITSIPFIGTINTEKIKRASKLGIDFLEWVCEYPHCYPPHISKRARLKLRRMSSEYDLKFSVHSTYVELDIAYLNPGLQEESVIFGVAQADGWQEPNHIAVGAGTQQD